MANKANENIVSQLRNQNPILQLLGWLKQKRQTITSVG